MDAAHYIQSPKDLFRSFMKFLTSAGSRTLVASLMFLLPAVGHGCDTIPVGQTVWARLTSPVSTYTAKPGDTVNAVLTEAIECDNRVVFPVGTNVQGVVHSVRKVGWGILHETAALGIQFDRVQAPEGAPVAISASVVEVENAREQVSKGTIQGIRSSDSPQGRINSRLRHLPTWNPYSDVGLIVFKASFPIFPEPEIYLPAGADLRLKLTSAITSSPDADSGPVPASLNDADSLELEESAQALPRRSTTPTLVDADIVNLAFIGSREEMESAFQQAGWVASDTFTRHSFMRDFYAFLNNSGYAQAPMRPFLLNGQPSDLNLEKSLNSYARRDHLRIWRWSGTNSDTVWLSSSTHDTGAALSLKHRQFVHHIAPDIDDERSKIIRDLSAAGCVQAVHLVPRAGMPSFTQNANGDLIRTDGSIAVVELKPCQPVVPELASVSTPPNFKAGNHVFRYFRRQILTFRSDIWRANIIYGAYDLGRMSFEAMKHRPPTVAGEQAKADHEAQFQRAQQHSNELTDYPAPPDAVAFH